MRNLLPHATAPLNENIYFLFLFTSLSFMVYKVFLTVDRTASHESHHLQRMGAMTSVNLER